MTSSPSRPRATPRPRPAGSACPLTTFAEHPVIDVTIDGADEVDPNLDLIKGGGGALLHEKIVAQASRREIIVVDEAKLSPALGTRVALPVEVVPFGQGSAAAHLRSLGGVPTLRTRRTAGPSSPTRATSSSIRPSAC